jgi:PAS domain-containing protein
VVTILRTDSTVDFASPAASQVWAVSPDELLGTQILQRIHLDDVPAARAHLAETIKQPATNIATELRVQHGDGSWRSVSSSPTTCSVSQQWPAHRARSAVPHAGSH